MGQHQIETVFHLAAQPLVRRSYSDPAETFSINVMGTVHVLEAARCCDSIRAVVIVTTDKCYENHEWLWGYREVDRLGGRDPYSCSKACAELVANAYHRSFFQTASADVGIATVRAGNVIGGGDWAEDRLVPDAIRALTEKRTLRVRNPLSIRPWQHAFEPLRGYLMLAERLHAQPKEWSGAWNFGPLAREAITAAELVAMLVKLWGHGRWEAAPESGAPHESQLLRLDCSKANQLLGWQPSLTIEQALALVVEWHRAALVQKADLRAISLQQLADYESLHWKSRPQSSARAA
jgi:CDP-glucose 4,6-dehydratase